MKQTSLIVTLTLMIPCVSRAFSQQPAPPMDRTSFNRPQPLTIVEDGDPSAILGTVSKILKSTGFDPVDVNNKEFFVDARRYSDKAHKRGDYDRIIVWMARDIKDPSRYVNVYFLYGRFVEVFGNAKALRVFIDEEDEERDIGRLKRELAAAVTTTSQKK